MNVRLINDWKRLINFSLINIELCRFFGFKLQIVFFGIGFVFRYVSKKQRLKFEESMGFLANIDWEE